MNNKISECKSTLGHVLNVCSSIGNNSPAQNNLKHFCEAG
jgi:hypothetical protein